MDATKGRDHMNRMASFDRKEAPFEPIPRPPSPTEEDKGRVGRKPDRRIKTYPIKRMRKVDPKQAERYRQRTGQ